MKKYFYNNTEYHSLYEIKKLLKNVSFPVNPTNEQLAELGITVTITEQVPPEEPVV
jgi:hypothetical protein